MISQNVRSGNYSLTLTGLTSGYKKASQVISDNIVGGNTYHFEGWIKATELNTGKFKFQIRWFDINGDEISDSRVSFGYTQTDTNYVKKAKDVVAPINATSARFDVQASKTDGTAYFDDFLINILE